MAGIMAKPANSPIEPEFTGSKQISTRFQPGVSGNPKGRPVGARSRLSEDLLSDLADAWKQHGAQALNVMAVTEPAKFVSAAISVLPKQSLVDIDIDVEMRASNALEAFRLLKNLGAPERRRLVIEHGDDATD